MGAQRTDLTSGVRLAHLDRARRYVSWVRRRGLAIVVAHLALVVGAGYLIANHLPVLADFSFLLPQDAPAVRDLRKLEARVQAGETTLVLVQAPDAASRASAMTRFATAARAVGGELVERVDDDDTEVRAFFSAHRHLFVLTADLRTAADALEAHLRRAKLRANPLYIDLDDKDPVAEQRDRKRLDELQAKRREAEAKLAKPMNISADGRTGLIQIRSPFRTTDAARGRVLLDRLSEIRDQVTAEHPAVEIGFAGSIVVAVAEHGAIVKGMALSSILTVVLVGLVLVWYFRSATHLVLLIGTLAISVVISFGLAALTVGHLNAATAFLGAIIAGNGVNYGILLIARYLEERRRHPIDDALAVAVVGTLRPTAIASLGASIAYGSLAATSFRGFADFAIIGAIGMLVCWVATYVLLPVLILKFAGRVRSHDTDPVLGMALVRVLGFRRSGLVCVAALACTAVATLVVVRYIAADPFEYDIKKLRSEGAAAVEAREWMQTSDKHFGRGLSNRTYIAADRIEQVPKIVEALRKHETFGTIQSILDVVPADQPAKLAILDRLRTLLDGAIAASGGNDVLDDKERSELLPLRPADGLAAITPERLPAPVRERLTERDGRIGYLISIRPANHLDEWNGRDLIRFAEAVRKIDLGNGETVTTSGSSVIFADIVTSIATDGPLVTGVASLGLLLMVLVLVGPNRRAFAVLAGTAGGTLLMVAVCALVGLRVNFLDFVALPITLGLGIDYAINIAHRHDHDHDPIAALRTSGSAVFVCSLTTIIGYGSLLASDNLAIKGFGTASLIGEVACVFTALVVVPAILATGARRYAA